MEIDYQLFGRDSLSRCDVGSGPQYQAAWELGRFPGPTLWWNLMGGSQTKFVYLDPSHLKLLYDRFKAANPSGVTIEQDWSFDRFAPAGYSQAELEKMEAERKIFVSLTLTDEDQGYPHLRAILPEAFEPAVVAALGADPWYDVRLLAKAIKDGIVPISHERDERWSPEWRRYCDRLK